MIKALDNKGFFDYTMNVRLIKALTIRRNKMEERKC